MTYATPSELWQLALPPDSLFEDGGLEPGAVGAVSKAGTGLGSLVVDPRSNPRDTWQVRTKCIVPGELNSDYVNPGPGPQFQISYDGGASYWWQPISPDAAGRLVVVKGGFSLQLANGTAGAPVTIGAGDAALICTPLRAGGSVKIVVGSALSHTFFNGALVLTVGASTTATQAAAYLAEYSAVYSYFTTAAGGTGAGVVQPAALTPLPFVSFAVNDTWSFSTAPSPDVLAAQRAAFDHLNSRWLSSFQLPLLGWDSGIKLCECIYARWNLIQRRGLDRRMDMRVYNPSVIEGGKEYADGVSNGNIHPAVIQSVPGATLFPDTVAQLDPLGLDVGSFPI